MPSQTAALDPTGTAEVPSSIETQLAAPTPTLAPYWDLQPLSSDPDGGWSLYQSEQFGIAFEYPTIYDLGSCGSIEIRDFDGDPAIILGATVQIRIIEPWGGDLRVHTSDFVSEKGTQLLTNVEQFTIDGIPAFRVIHTFGEASATQYEKLAFASFRDRLFSFRYALANLVYCDAPPLSEESVFEHLLSTWSFDR